MTRILSIDGGGIRGLVPAMVLAEIEKSTQKPIVKLFDVTQESVDVLDAEPGDDALEAHAPVERRPQVFEQRDLAQL